MLSVVTKIGPVNAFTFEIVAGYIFRPALVTFRVNSQPIRTSLYRQEKEEETKKPWFKPACAAPLLIGTTTQQDLVGLGTDFLRDHAAEHSISYADQRSSDDLVRGISTHYAVAHNVNLVKNVLPIDPLSYPEGSIQQAKVWTFLRISTITLTEKN